MGTRNGIVNIRVKRLSGPASMKELGKGGKTVDDAGVGGTRRSGDGVSSRVQCYWAGQWQGTISLARSPDCCRFQIPPHVEWMLLELDNDSMVHVFVDFSARQLTKY
jgi:hypothetical protein